MNCYKLVEKDQPRSSWAIHDRVKSLPMHQKRPELPSVIYRFFGPESEGEMQMKSEYRSLRCKTCGCYDDDSVFNIGFFDPVIIRIKGDFAGTQDRVFAISDKFLKVIKNAKTYGFETKPIGTTGWHAFRVTERVDCDESVMSLLEPFCLECNRPDRVPGTFEYSKQLSLPARSNTFFTTKKGWAKPFHDRAIFLTEDVMQILKKGGVTGGWCNRLWTDDEVQVGLEKAKQGKKWTPPGWCVSL